jgi:hypothetical protein
MDLTSIKVFMGRLRNGHVYSVSSTAIENSVARLQAVVTSVVFKVLRCVQENEVWRNVLCLEIDGGSFQNLLLRCAHGLNI